MTLVQETGNGQIVWTVLALSGSICYALRSKGTLFLSLVKSPSEHIIEFPGAIPLPGGTWQCGIQVNFTPLGAHQFLHLPMHLLSNRVIELDDLLGLVASRLVERLHETPSWEARFALLDAFISTRLAEGRTPTTSVAWAWHKLHETDGCLGIGALAAELGCSEKHLIAQFHEQIGLPPKTLARILRFNHALRHLERIEGARCSEIAHDCGYYDQAHLIKDFRAFTGSTPGEFLARRLPDSGGICGD